MERCDDKGREEYVEADRATPGKMPYRQPELTKHELLTEITLGTQCTLTIPACVSPQDPYA